MNEKKQRPRPVQPVLTVFNQEFIHFIVLHQEYKKIDAEVYAEIVA